MSKPGKLSLSEVVTEYTKYDQKINLEALSPKAANRMLIATYISFLICFFTDLLIILSSASPLNQVLSPCYGANSEIPFTTFPTGQVGFVFPCYDPNTTTPYDTQIVSYLFQSPTTTFALSATQTNFTGLVNWDTGSAADVCSPVSLSYNLIMLSCQNPIGCGSDLASIDSTNSNDPSTWHFTYRDTGVNINTNMCDLKNNGEFTWNFIYPSLLNEESIPSFGKISSFLVIIRFYNNPAEMWTPLTESIAKSITYDFGTLTASTSPLLDSIIIFTCIVVATWALIRFIRSLFRNEPDHRKWLPEQNWALANLVFLIIYLNPLYCGLVWVPSSINYLSSYTVYLLNAIGFAGFLCIWSFYASPLGIRKEGYPLWKFYVPRTFFALCNLVSSVAMLTYLFPSVSDTLEYSSTTVINDWPAEDRQAFVGLALFNFIVTWGWAITWFIQLWLTSRKLKKFNYMTNRYIHLSFRYYSIQATLVTLMYIIQLILTAIIIYSTNYSGKTTSLGVFAILVLADYRNSRTLIGKLIFTTIFSLILVFCYFPIDKSKSDNIESKLTSTYVITEDEMHEIVKKRKTMINKLNKLQRSLLNNVAAFNPYVFCVDKALNLCHISYEIYFDQPGQPTAAGLGHDENDLKDMDIESSGYEFIALNNDEAHDTFCIIARHKITRKLLIAFRGTSSGKNWNDNAKYTQIPLRLHLDPPSDKLSTPFITKHLIESAKKAVNLDNNMDNESDFHSCYDHDEIKSDHPSPTRSSIFGHIFHRAQFDDDFDAVSESQKSVSSTRSGRPTLAALGHGFRLTHAEPNQNTSSTCFECISTAVTTTLGAVTVVTDAISAATCSCAKRTSGLETLTLPFVHQGFCEAYMTAREFVHTSIRQELSKELGDVLVTGHSLGGALGGLCALDIQIHTLASINIELEMIHAQNKSKHIHDHSLPRKLHLSMYSYGSPKIGNNSFVEMYDDLVPDSFRVVVDGDVVPAVPPFRKYTHMGTEVLIDGLGHSGNIIINPSSVEKALIQKTKSSVMGHLLGAYKHGLETTKLASGVTNGVSVDKVSARKLSDMNDDMLTNNDPTPLANSNEENSLKPRPRKLVRMNSDVGVAKTAIKIQNTFRHDNPSFFRYLPFISENEVNDDDNDDADCELSEDDFFDCQELHHSGIES